MLLTLALIILGASVVVFFSEEFAKVIKKLFAFYWVRLLFPIMLTSMLIEHYDQWVFWLLLRIKEFLLYLVYYGKELMPFEFAAKSLSKILCLYLIASIPVWILHLLAKRKMIPEPWEHTYFTSILLWVCSVILLIVP